MFSPVVKTRLRVSLNIDVETKQFPWIYSKKQFLLTGTYSQHNSTLISFAKPFLYARLKNGTYYGNTCGGRAASTEFPLSKSKSFHSIFIKLGEYVGGHNISTKFYNQPNPPGTPELWLLNCQKLSKIRVSAL